MKILVSFSGGKDSQAWGVGGNLIAVFCDTGWEHPDTYKHVNNVCLQMGVRLITLKSKYDFVSLAVHKKRFPSTNARFCTSELKMKPMECTASYRLHTGCRAETESIVLSWILTCWMFPVYHVSA